MRPALFFLLILFFSTGIFSQSQQNNIQMLPQGNPLGELNGHGFSGLANNASNIGFINPAALNNFENISFGFSYEFENEIKNAWIADFGFKRDVNIVPQSAGFVLPAGNFRAGLSMSQAYNGGLNIGAVLVTTAQNPDGIGTSEEIVIKNILYKYSISASYSFENLVQGGSLSIGGRFNLNRMTNTSNQAYAVDMSFGGSNWSAGAAFKKYFGESKYYHVGLFFENSMSLDLTETKGPGLYVTPDSGNTQRPPAYNYVSVPSYKAQLPSRLKMDFDISAVQSLKFSGSVSEVFWNDIDTGSSNETEFSGSAEYSFNDMISSSIGFLTTQKKYNDLEKYYHLNNNLNAFFITLGTVVNFNNIIVDISLADSHLLSGDWRKQTIVKIGMGYTL